MYLNLLLQNNMLPPDPNKPYPKETESDAVIRFQDCDPLGHLNNAKYFDYFFNAREDQVTKVYGYSPGEIYKRFGCSWVVYNHNISYIRSVTFGEWVKIMSRVIYYDINTVVVEYYMTDQAKQKLICLLWTTTKYVDVRTGKTTSHHPEVLRLLEVMKLKDFQMDSISIKERIRQIKQELSAANYPAT
ncbi:MAG: thioesterase [Chitinophagales bacterium]|nr:MAG: thioesterase [Chitinophagales bacterium]